MKRKFNLGTLHINMWYQIFMKSMSFFSMEDWALEERNKEVSSKEWSPILQWSGRAIFKCCPCLLCHLWFWPYSRGSRQYLPSLCQWEKLSRSPAVLPCMFWNSWVLPSLPFLSLLTAVANGCILHTSTLLDEILYSFTWKLREILKQRSRDCKNDKESWQLDDNISPLKFLYFLMSSLYWRTKTKLFRWFWTKTLVKNFSTTS